MCKIIKNFLAQPGDAVSLLDCVRKCLRSDNGAYTSFLKKSSKIYSIENSVKAHLRVFETV